MRPRDRVNLLHGPYPAPARAAGRKLFCEIRGTVTVGGYSDGPIPWPRMKKPGSACLILCGDLVRAVLRESNQAVAHHFGVSTHTVTKWRKALVVPEYNEGTRRLGRDWAGRPHRRAAGAGEAELSRPRVGGEAGGKAAGQAPAPQDAGGG